MTELFHWNEGWQFTPAFSPALCVPEYTGDALEPVRIPHTVKTLPYHYFSEESYQMVSGYRKVFFAPKAWQGRQVCVNFGAVAHEATVYCNGEEVVRHSCGYTAFSANLSAHLRFDAENSIVVKCDSRETLNQPPFGNVVDYLTFGGMYRAVTLSVKESTHLKDVFVTANADGSFRIYTTLVGEALGCVLKAEIESPDGVVSHFNGAASLPLTGALHDARTWHPDHPALYTLRLSLVRTANPATGLPAHMLDSTSLRFGFRTVAYKADGLYLNGEKIKLRGLNRHQSWPYQGYAMPDSQQWLDACQLKNELGCNAVRTSHYPQSHAFLNACDSLGLLVFTEMPGWQHIGDADWKAIALENCREMVLQYRNHASIFMWGVRINESADDDDFYRKTNEVVHRLDPTRPTGGVRCIKNSNCFEDVYTYNDFSHTGQNAGCEVKRAVTSSPKKGYLISEYNGHMFPTKPSDNEPRRLSHTLRHARVLADIAAQKDIGGGFGWCMFDYNTHKDFGAGDRICYHGVLDMFRNPKMAAAVYASQKDITHPRDVVLEVSSDMNIGDHDAGVPGELWVFTNAEYVAVYKNDKFIATFAPKTTGKFAALAHPPILIDDLIGGALEEDELFAPDVANTIKECLQAFRIYGMDLPPLQKAKMAKVMLVNHLTMEDATRLHAKYVANWGSALVNYRFDAIAGGRVLASVRKEAMQSVSLAATVRNPDLFDGPTWDCASVQLCANDQNGNVLPYYNEPVSLSLTGPAVLIGPAVVPLRGGLGGTYIASTGETGTAVLTCTLADCAPVEVTINIQKRAHS